MARDPPAPELLLRERAYLALLLLVGGGAVTLGVYESLATGGRSISAVFDLALGACVLLVTWLFLAPAALPSFFGDPAPGAPPAARPYLRPVAGPGPIVMAPARSPEPAATPAPPIPRWADPMVHPKVAGPVRPPVSHRPAHLTREPAPRAAAPEVPEPPPPLPRPTEAQLFDGLPEIEETDPVGLPTLPDERADPSPPPRGAEILDELDRLEAELRSFVPVDAALRPPAGVARRGGSGI